MVPDRDNEEEREAFDDADMKLIRASLHRLSESDQLLVRLLATTGMRRGEAFEINREQIGERYPVRDHRHQDAAIAAPRSIPGRSVAVSAAEDHRPTDTRPHGYGG